MHTSDTGSRRQCKVELELARIERDLLKKAGANNSQTIARCDRRAFARCAGYIGRPCRSHSL